MKLLYSTYEKENNWILESQMFNMAVIYTTLLLAYYNNNLTFQIN